MDCIEQSSKTVHKQLNIKRIKSVSQNCQSEVDSWLLIPIQLHFLAIYLSANIYLLLCQ